MTPFETASVLIAVAAVCGYVNKRLLRLPSSTGTLVVALAGSLVVLAAGAVLPGSTLREQAAQFVQRIDFNQTVIRGMLSFLLFAGALQVDLERLLAQRWRIGLLSTAGVAISTVVTGAGAYRVFHAMSLDVSWMTCFVFGALISPTDPVAVLALMKELGAPKDLEVQIAGEALFNDGMGVVLFFALAGAAGLLPGVGPEAAHAGAVVWFVIREVGGGAVLGLASGYTAYRALKRLNDHPLEVLITLALVMFTYALSFRLHVSGPIAIVIAGVLIGNPGKQKAMTAISREYVEVFWEMIDEILNAVLFLLLGLEALGVSSSRGRLLAGALMIPIVLGARWLSVAAPLAALKGRERVPKGLIPALTWGGLRGGLSIAMVLGLPKFPHKDLLLMCTYVIAVFSIIVQGLTMRRLLHRYGLAGPAAR